MKVILQKDIHNLGEAGDIKEVADGYARNYLLPRNLVMVANDNSKKILQHQEKVIKIKKAKRKKQSEKLLESLNNLEVKIAAQAGEEGKLFGAVTPIDIAKKLKELGYEIDKRKIAHADPIKQLGEYIIPVKLDVGLTANLKVQVEKA
ncbi:MAG: 50S ribosomal protein L9 [Spirochaetes bacterium]|nr:50S ribosomal protein L9 [Spirochaetota bacterium]